MMKRLLDLFRKPLAPASDRRKSDLSDAELLEHWSKLKTINPEGFDCILDNIFDPDKDPDGRNNFTILSWYVSLEFPHLDDWRERYAIARDMWMLLPQVRSNPAFSRN